MTEPQDWEDPKLSALYRRGERPEPPAELDERIRQAARDALRTRRVGRWPAFATAALLLLGVGLALRVFDTVERQTRQPELFDEAPAESAPVFIEGGGETVPADSFQLAPRSPQPVMREPAPAAATSASEERRKVMAPPPAEPMEERLQQQLSSPVPPASPMNERLEQEESGAPTGAVSEADKVMQGSLSKRADSACDIAGLEGQPAEVWLQEIERVEKEGRAEQAECLKTLYEERFGAPLSEQAQPTD